MCYKRLHEQTGDFSRSHFLYVDATQLVPFREARIENGLSCPTNSPRKKEAVYPGPFGLLQLQASDARLGRTGVSESMQPHRFAQLFSVALHFGRCDSETREREGESV